MSYQDSWKRWHHKPCIGGEPSSNNGWIFTAYAYHLGLEFDFFMLETCYSLCAYGGKIPMVDRSPYKPVPPMSRDEVIGMLVCGVITCKDIESSYWQFCNYVDFTAKPLWKINWFKAVAALWRIRNEHRNALWYEEDLWNVGFRLMPQDTWFVLRLAERKTSLIHTAYFYLSSIMTVFGKNSSGKLILWLKLKELKMEGSFLYTYLEWENAFRDCFVKDHPFLDEL